MSTEKKLYCVPCDKLVEPISGFGLAGGGYGAYYICPHCDTMIRKDQELGCDASEQMCPVLKLEDV